MNILPDMEHFKTKALCCCYVSMLLFACTTPASKTTKGIAEDRHTENAASGDAETSTPMQKDTAYISLEKTVYTPKDSFVYYRINNCFDSAIRYGAEYRIERYDNGRWQTVKCDVGFTLVAYYIEPSQKVDCRARLAPVYNLTSGKYRIEKDLHVFCDTENETMIKIYGEFTVK